MDGLCIVNQGEILDVRRYEIYGDINDFVYRDTIPCFKIIEREL